MTDPRWKPYLPYNLLTEPVAMSQVVAENMRRARRMRGLTQAELGYRLRDITGAAWPRSLIAMFEAAWSNENERARRLDVNQLCAVAIALDMPISWFFLPPEEIPENQGSAWLSCTTKERHDDHRLYTSDQLADLALSRWSAPGRMEPSLQDRICQQAERFTSAVQAEEVSMNR